MFVSVVLPCYNGASTLPEMLDSLVRQTFQGEWELVFVNNGSSDASVDIALSYRDRLPVRIVNAYIGTGPRGGVAHSYTAGFRAAKGGLILTCESDDALAPDYMERVVQALETADFVAPAIDYELLNPPGLTWGKDQGQQSRTAGLPDFAGPLWLPFASFCAIGMRRTCYERVGDPSDSMGGGLDVDYCWRVQLAGMKITFVPDAVAHYRLRHTAKARFRQAEGWGRTQVSLLLRYGLRPWPRYLAYVLFYLAKSTLALALGTISGRRPFAYWTWNVGYAWGQLQSVPVLMRAHARGHKPDADILAGRPPAGPQTLIPIPDA